MSRVRLGLLALLTLSAGACATTSTSTSPGNTLLPVPQSVVTGSGAFRLLPTTPVVLGDGVDGEVERIAAAWVASLGVAEGGLPVARGACDARSICLRVSETGPAEGYTLLVTSDSVVVAGNDHAGLFYGLETLTQMLPSGRSTTLPSRIASTTVSDAPRFGYRGMHLDVGRHFFGPDFVKRYIDQLARYKINRFHWHLTEDQGWRIEIDGYPRLTEVAAWRSETMVEKNFEPYVGDGTRYGGFYTQDEIRDIVAYAQDRYVTIVPEIEMPGHSLAALAAYPELACTEGPFEVATRWGVFEDIYCPKEETFTFLEDVLTQVMDLFPGEYIHIGGDEAPKAAWEKSEVAQEVMRREGLADEHELQSWFIQRIERFLNDRGRRLLGWDEILEGGLAPNATVMSWRGTEGGIEAARQGHDVVMTPNSHMYFDHYQGDPEQEPLAIGGFLTLERVYGYEPVPDELDATEGERILGAQGNMWTEYMKTEGHVEYMLFPRLFALSEVVWSQPEARSFPDFAARLPWHLERLDEQGVRYRIPDVLGLERDRLVLEEKVEVALGSAARGTIRYSTDGSEPTTSSMNYVGPLEVNLRDGPVTVAARLVTPDGTLGPIRRATYTRTEPRVAAMVGADLEPGFFVDLYQGRFRRVADIERRGQTSVRREKVDGVVIPEWATDEQFGLRYRGYLNVPADGVYTLRLTSDDGSVLRIAGSTILDHDGLHGPSEREAQVALALGLHPFEVLYFQAGGASTLKLEWAGPDDVFSPLDASVVQRVR